MKTSTGNRFEELFRERFKDFGENPPENVLERIKNTTSKTPASKPFWKQGGFFAGSIVVVIGTVLLITHPFSSSQNNTAPEKKMIAENISVTDNKATDLKNDIIVQNNNTKQQLQNENNIQNSTRIELEKVNKEIISSDNNNSTEQISSQDNSTAKNSQPENKGNVKYLVNVHIKAATCRKSNGFVSLSSSYGTDKILFYWTDFDNEAPHSSMNNLRAGTYHIKSVSDLGIIQNFAVTVPDSGIARARFTHYEMTQAIGVPVYFTNKSIVDGVETENIENVLYKWYFGDGKISAEMNPEHSYNSTGPFTVSLVVISPQGCKDSTCLPPLTIAGSDIETSDIFTPNGDGNNDIFTPVAQGLSSFKCTIFNRNGQLIYEWTDPTQGWDGKINHGSQLAAKGTYYYVITGTGIDGKFIQKQHFLTINY